MTPASTLGTLFIGVVRMWLGLGRLRMLLPVVLVAFGVFIARNARARRSRLIQAGGGLLLLGIVPLVLAALSGDNGLGLGFVFAFLVPIGLLLVVIGTLRVVFARP